ncbi:hypothetical protein Tco_0466176 [Tanacetum coccineum]
MDDPNITMEEYIRLQEEKALSRGETFDWQTATYGKIEYCENKDDSFTNLETEYPTIVFDDTSDASLSCEPTVSPLDNNEIDFKILFDESDDEDYMVIFDKNSFSCKTIYVDNLKTNSEDENDKVNMPSSLSPEPTFGYIDDLDFFKDFENEFPAIAYNDLNSKSDPLIEPSVSSQHIDKFEMSLSKYDEKEQNILCLDDSFPLNGLTVTAPALPIIDMTELVRLQICVELDDTWAWVPAGPARQEGDARGVAEEAPVAPGGGDEYEVMPQADQREVLDSMARDLSRFTTWTITGLSRLMDRAGMPYMRYSESPVEYQGGTRQRTGDASTSVAPHEPDP